MAVITPADLDAALRAADDAPDALIVAGGTDAMVEVNAGQRRQALASDTVIVLDRVREMRRWSYDPDRSTVMLGAGVTYTELMTEPLASWLPALAEASRTVGSPQIRNAGTIGGNLATCSPAGDTLPVLAALDAEVHLATLKGQRTLPIAEFMLGVKTTALAPGELIVGVTVPVLRGPQGYAKVGVRNAMVIAIASACVIAAEDLRSVRIALGSVAPTIIRCHDAERYAAANLDWSRERPTPGVAAETGERAAADARPIDDHRSTATYRSRAVALLVARLVRRGFPDA